jgi:hypothetical protein
MKQYQRPLEQVSFPSFVFYIYAISSLLPHQTGKVQWPNSTMLAQILCRIERRYAKHVGPEEFVQCSGNLVKEPTYDKPSTSGAAPGVQDPKKTCNLESYFEWFVRLKLLVANEILQVTKLEKIIALFLGSFFFHLLFTRPINVVS